MGVTLFGLVFLAIGLFMFIRGLWLFRASRASRSWPSVQGQVIAAMVEKRVDTDEDGSTTRYMPRTVYSYSVQGQQYTCDKVAIGSTPWYNTYAKAQSKLAYEAGQKVTVSYNPEKPAKAVLEPGSSRGVWSSLIIGAGFIIFGAIAAAGYIQP
jgi:hypothetical protein